MCIRNSQSLFKFVILIFIAIFVARVFTAPQREFGDGREYILQTQSIVFDHELTIEPKLRTGYWNSTNPFGVTLSEDPHTGYNTAPLLTASSQFGGGYGSLYPDKNRKLYFAHSWAYSLATAPIYGFLHAISDRTLEYYAFRVVNVTILFLVLLALWRISPTLKSFLFIALFLTSPITPHLQFAHAEIFCLATTLGSFALLISHRFRFMSPFLLGLGAAQNIPIALFFPLHLWMMGRRSGFSHWGRYLPWYALGVALPIGIMSFYYVHFGALNIIAATGHADFSNVTLTRLKSLLLSPQIGVWWYYPAAWIAVLVSWRRGSRLDVILSLLSCVAVAALCSATTNINSAQLCAPRYAVWFLAPLYALPFWSASRAVERRSVTNTWLLRGGIFIAAASMIGLQTFYFLSGSWSRFSPNSRTDSSVAALYNWLHFNDDVESLVENTIGSELQVAHDMRGVYIWNLNHSSSMWIVTKRAAQTESSITVTGDTERLLHSTEIQRSFTIVNLDGDRVVLALKNEGEFDRNPYWGGYRILWVDGNVSKANGSVPVVVR